MMEERDPLDVARLYTERDIAAREAAHRAMMAAIQPADQCVGCGDDIPETRRKAIRTNFCVACADAAEKQRSKYARR